MEASHDGRLRLTLMLVVVQVLTSVVACVLVLVREAERLHMSVMADRSVAHASHMVVMPMLAWLCAVRTVVWMLDEYDRAASHTSTAALMHTHVMVDVRVKVAVHDTAVLVMLVRAVHL